MEGGVFGGGADEDEGAVFDVGQEGVLLGLKDGFAHFFDAGEDGREADEARREAVGQQQG